MVFFFLSLLIVAQLDLRANPVGSWQRGGFLGEHKHSYECVCVYVFLPSVCMHRVTTLAYIIIANRAGDGVSPWRALLYVGSMGLEFPFSVSVWLRLRVCLLKDRLLWGPIKRHDLHYKQQQPAESSCWGVRRLQWSFQHHEQITSLLPKDCITSADRNAINRKVLFRSERRLNISRFL